MRTEETMNGIRVTRAAKGKHTMFIPLPRAVWREITRLGDGPACECAHCKSTGAQHAYWDTLAVDTDEHGYGYTWTVHYPELQANK